MKSQATAAALGRKFSNWRSLGNLAPTLRSQSAEDGGQNTQMRKTGTGMVASHWQLDFFSDITKDVDFDPGTYQH